MTSAEFHERAALAAAGILEHHEQAMLEAYCAHHPEAQNEFRWLKDAVAAFARVTTVPCAPTPALRERLLAKILRTAQVPTDNGVTSASNTPLPPGFSTTSAWRTPWQPTPIPGLRTKHLTANEAAGYRVVLLALDANCRFPSHRHARGAEELFVISGDLVTEGQTLRAGDFLHAEAGTEHGELWSPSGCVALVVEPVGK